MVLIEFGGNTNEDGEIEGVKSKKLDDIIREDVQQMDDTQREYFYKEGLLKYGEKRWEKKIIELDFIELNKNPELDPENYNIKDLFDLLDLEKDDTNIEDIDPSVALMKETLDENSNSDNMETIEKYKTFFDAVAERLKKFITEGKTEISDNLIQKQDFSKIKRSMISCAQSFVVNSERIEKKFTSNICPDGSFEYKIDRYLKTNFEVILEFKLSDTSKLNIGNVIIPLSGYFPIDSAYNTNTFSIKDISKNKEICIELEPQQPKQAGVNGTPSAYEGFISNFNNVLNRAGISDLSLNFNSLESTFVLSTDSIKGYEIDWLSGDCDNIYCVGQKSNLTTKDRPNSTLGFLMGFNTDDENGGKITIKKNSPKTANRGHSRMIGSDMFFLQITDYTGSTLNHNKINMAKPIQNFKQPYYFNSIKSRIGLDNSLNFCEKYKETKTRSSRKGTANNTDINIMDTLSQAQKYTMKAIEAANNKIKENGLTTGGVTGGVTGGDTGGDTGTGGVGGGTGAGIGKKIRIPIPANNLRGGPPGQLVQSIRFSGSRDNICPILFSGNTDIIKIGIALYDQNDFLVDLHGEGIIVTFNTDQEKTEIS